MLKPEILDKLNKTIRKSLELAGFGYISGNWHFSRENKFGNVETLSIQLNKRYQYIIISTGVTNLQIEKIFRKFSPIQLAKTHPINPICHRDIGYEPPTKVFSSWNVKNGTDVNLFLEQLPKILTQAEEFYIEYGDLQKTYRIFKERAKSLTTSQTFAEIQQLDIYQTWVLVPLMELHFGMSVLALKSADIYYNLLTKNTNWPDKLKLYLEFKNFLGQKIKIN